MRQPGQQRDFAHERAARNIRECHPLAADLLENLKLPLHDDEQPLSGIAFGEQDVAGLQVDGFALSPQLLKIIVRERIKQRQMTKFLWRHAFHPIQTLFCILQRNRHGV